MKDKATLRRLHVSVDGYLWAKNPRRATYVGREKGTKVWALVLEGYPDWSYMELFRASNREVALASARAEYSNLEVR